MSTFVTPTSWTGKATYKPSTSEAKPPLEEGDSSGYEFEVGGDTWHITQAIETDIYGLNALDFQGAINVSRDDNGNWTVAGTDLGSTAGAFHWSETNAYGASSVDDAYVAKLSALVWTTNTVAFRGWAAGEVLFTGARGSKRGDGLWEITFNYAVLQNKGAFTIPLSGGDDAIKVTGGKDGWDYMWVYYRTELSGAGPLRMIPKSVYVEQVYEHGDFSDIEPSAPA